MSVLDTYLHLSVSLSFWGMREQWSLLNNLGDGIFSTFVYVPYVGSYLKNDRFRTSTFGCTHPHTFPHILYPHLFATHSFSTTVCRTFFFHICCTHFFSTSLGMASLGNSCIFTMPSAYSHLCCEGSQGQKRLRVELLDLSFCLPRHVEHDK